MTAGAGNRKVARPAPYSGPRRNGAEVTYYLSFYRCECGTKPFVRMGCVTVEHAIWCPTGQLREMLAKR